MMKLTDNNKEYERLIVECFCPNFNVTNFTRVSHSKKSFMPIYGRSPICV